MSDVHSAAAWSLLLLPVVLTAFAWAAATLDAVVAARMAGRGAATGLTVPVRSTARLLVKQRRTTVAPDVLLWRLGGGGVVVVACVASVVIPLGAWSVADLSIGIVWWSAFIAILWALLHMLGYSPNSAYPLVGGYRFVAQAMAYEMPLAISIICAALAAHSLRVGAVVAGQHGLWYAVWMPAAFVIYLICSAAASFYGPFATTTASDLGGGVLAELSGVDRLFVVAGRYLVLASASAFAVALFLGGGAGPWLPAAVWSVVKTLLVLGLLVGLRWLVPLVRMERFEEFAWGVLLPAAVVQALVVSLVVL